MRPWAEYLADRGLTVSLPLLPGHGTRWQDMQLTTWRDWYATVERELRALRETCEQVFVFGLSMGGTLALRLAALHGDAVTGVVVVNPANRLHGFAPKLVPLVRFLLPSTPGIADDIAKEGAHELGYSRTPLHAVHSFTELLKRVDGELPQVTQPLLLLHSRVDHVVSPKDSARVLGRVSSLDVTETVLERSYHVATLDHDAEQIFEDSYAFVRRLSGSEGADGRADGAQEEATRGGA
ncbi:Thermostable monoacylglycerol lipase [Streptomyces sp. RB5]|uniref:Thermostable monoacylglycerol lipase n=2 Tax=Streptomyces smaragdinus TaxID=2585196 RepID=A0A7K0CP76_9ACTN|nr:Thermostable monoacylglycerol lipase [Streptomyces smaragdinus]